jgi:hypothetical protein
MPPYYNTALFTKGIATLSQVLGQKHKRICMILLRLFINLPLPCAVNSLCMMKVVHTLLDFLYLMQFTSYTSETICQLQDSLTAFHNNKGIFIDLGVQNHFNISKLHSLIYYKSSIQLFRTTDNYNTEQSKHLHINVAKDVYCTTDHKDKYPQITNWLE